MKNYIYSYRDILKAIIKYLCLTTTKSKVINPLYIGTRLNSASFEDTIIGFVDCRRIIKQAGLPINYIFILLATLDGYTLKQMASVLGLAKSTVCYHRKRCKKLVRSIQKYDR
jgi:hypothetical protein